MVWNISMVFFQIMLLAGYLYAHFLSRAFKLYQQFLIHLTLVGIACFTLPQVEDDDTGRTASTWVIMASNDGFFSAIANESEGWRGTEPDPKVGIWADDYAKVISTMTFY